MHIKDSCQWAKLIKILTLTLKQPKFNKVGCTTSLDMSYKENY